MIEFWHGTFPKMASILPEQEHTNGLRIVHCTPGVADATLGGLRAMTGFGRGSVRAGDTYAQIWDGSRLWMSDTPDERRDHRVPVARAFGSCLVGGLGLGMCALAMAQKPDVNVVDVVEKDRRVIDLIFPLIEPYSNGKIRIIEADLMEWRPSSGQAWDVVWFDIWPTLCTDDLKGHATLNRRFGRRTRFWRGCWGHELLVRAKKQKIRDRAGWRW